MTHAEPAPVTRPPMVARQLDSIAWGLFFLWVGIAIIANLGWGVALLGVGVITLGGQMTRKYFDLAIEPFWLVVGVLFVLGGLWELLAVRYSLVPIVLILAGVALLISAMRRQNA